MANIVLLIATTLANEPIVIDQTTQETQTHLSVRTPPLSKETLKMLAEIGISTTFEFPFEAIDDTP